MKILLYDIESTPILSYNWGIYEQNAIRVKREWYMLSYSYKWAHQKIAHSVGLNDFPNFDKNFRDDSALVKSLHKLFNEADVLIAHNGNKFDQKKSHARFIFHGLPPPKPYKQIDTRLVAKQRFAFTSNKLDDLGDYLGVGRKLRIHPEVWEDCMNGKRSAFGKMKKYNKQDVLLLERVYLKLRPWIQNHPSFSLFSDDPDACPVCGKGSLRRRGYYYTKTNKIQQFSCNACMAWVRYRVSDNIIKPRYVN